MQSHLFCLAVLRQHFNGDIWSLGQKPAAEVASWDGRVSPLPLALQAVGCSPAHQSSERGWTTTVSGDQEASRQE